jgi:DNA primase
VVHGVNNLAAPLGTALTLAHIRSLKGYADKVILLFDGDQAGFKAALRAVPLFLTEQLPAEIVILPDNHDPDSFIRKHGKGKLTELIKRARSLPEFVFEALVAQHGLTLEGKSKIIQDLRPIISLIDDKNLQRTLFVSHFSKKLDLAPQQLQEGIPARVPPAVKTAEKQECRRKVNPLLPMKQRQLLEFLIIYPEHIQDFCNAGLEDFIVEPFAREILDLLAANAGTGYHSGNPEKLLEIAQGDTRSFISRVLISTPVFTEEIKAEIATEWITWLKKSQMKLKKNSLVHLIGKAHQNNNEQLCMDLMEQKKQLDEGLVS